MFILRKLGVIGSILFWIDFILVFICLMLLYPRIGGGFVSITLLSGSMIINFFGVDKKDRKHKKPKKVL